MHVWSLLFIVNNECYYLDSDYSFLVYQKNNKINYNSVANHNNNIILVVRVLVCTYLYYGVYMVSIMLNVLQSCIGIILISQHNNSVDCLPVVKNIL